MQHVKTPTSSRPHCFKDFSIMGQHCKGVTFFFLFSERNRFPVYFKLYPQEDSGNESLFCNFAILSEF